jgi:cell division transport system permease protein
VASIFKNMMANIRREKLLSISNVMIMTVTFLLLGIFIYVIAVSQTAIRYLEQQVQLSVFFKDDYTEANILALKGKLEADKRISYVNYVSKDQAFKTFSEINKDEPILLESISPSVLPASLEVRSYNIADLSPLSEELSKGDGVEEVRFFKDVIQKFKDWSTVVYIVGFILTAAFFVISYTVVISTLRTTIHSKGVELDIMKLVGASDKYVKLPLIYQGVTFGVVAAALAGLLEVSLGLILYHAGAFRGGFSFGFLPSVTVKPIVFLLTMFVILLLSGALLGLVGSTSAIKKYLKY